MPDKDDKSEGPGAAPAPRAAAFFDLDRTLMEGSSAFQYGRAAYRAGLMSRRQLIADAWANLRFRLRGSTDADTEALRDRISRSLEGVRVRELERLGADVLVGVLPRLYPQMLTIAHRHQDEGLSIYIVTAASQELAELLARVLAFDGAIGSRFSEIRDGVYTGRPEGVFVYRTGKAEAIEALAAREGLDLTRSYAYSDSESDLPMLSVVGHPVVVNPDRDLAQIAREHRWEVLRFDHLSRRLKTGAVLGSTAAAGGVVSVVLNRRTRAARRRAQVAVRPPWRPRRLRDRVT
jgi:HAD superfamily hydrolase (TIGR01490 family)